MARTRSDDIGSVRQKGFTAGCAQPSGNISEMKAIQHNLQHGM
jgi:hypothetical protein